MIVDPEEQTHRLERDILTRELGELGARSGGIGGGLGGAIGGGLGGLFGGRRGGQRGGRRGAERGARRLGEDRCELAIEFDTRSEEVLAQASVVLANEGKPCTDPFPPGECPELWAVVGTGIGGLNPSVVRVAVISVDGDRTHAVVRAVALEGLVKQHGGRKAATRIRDALVAAVGNREAPGDDHRRAH